MDLVQDEDVRRGKSRRKRKDSLRGKLDAKWGDPKDDREVISFPPFCLISHILFGGMIVMWEQRQCCHCRVVWLGAG